MVTRTSTDVWHGRYPGTGIVEDGGYRGVALTYNIKIALLSGESVLLCDIWIHGGGGFGVLVMRRFGKKLSLRVVTVSDGWRS